MLPLGTGITYQKDPSRWRKCTKQRAADLRQFGYSAGSPPQMPVVGQTCEILSQRRHLDSAIKKRPELPQPARLPEGFKNSDVSDGVIRMPLACSVASSNQKEVNNRKQKDPRCCREMSAAAMPPKNEFCSQLFMTAWVCPATLLRLFCSTHNTQA